MAASRLLRLSALDIFISPLVTQGAFLLGKPMSETRKVGFVIAAENETKQTFDEVKRDAKSMADAVTKAGDDAAKGLSGMGEGGEKAANKMDGSTRSIISSIQRATAAIEAGEKGSSKYFAAIAQQRNIGADVLEPYLAQMRKAEAAQAASVGGLGKMEMSAKATAAALRGVPAQFTDIMVSLQGGQAPLTVFLQQGGQLKDMFGGAGNAAKALGGYIMGLVNPFTITAAGIAAIGVAYYQGSKEQGAFTRSIIMSGNASGVTAGQLRDYAREIDSVIGTQAQAAEGLAAFVAAGVTGGEELRRYTQTAIEWEQATGQAVEKTAEQFASLQKDPLKAVLKLNEGTNFLTTSVYEQIKALEEQGDKAGAAEVAMNALDGAMRDRSRAIEQSLGYIEVGWRRIKKEAAEAWDAMLNVGRPATKNDELARIQTLIANKEVGLDGYRNTRAGKIVQDEINQLRAKELALQGVINTEVMSAAVQADAIKLTQAKITWDQAGTQYLPKSKKMEQELAAARNEATAAGIKGKELDDRLAAIREKYTEKTKGAGAAERARNKELNDQAKTIAELSGLSGSFRKDWDNLNKVYAKGGMSLEALEQAQAKLLAKQPFAIALAREEEKVRRELEKAIEDDIKAFDRLTTSRQGAIKTLEQTLQKARDEEKAYALSAMAGITLAEATERLTIARLEDHLIMARQGAESQTVIDQLERELAARRELQGVLQQRGVREANKKAAEEAAKDWDKTAQTISRSLTDYIMSGGQDAAQYLKRLFANLVLEPVIQTGVGSLLGVSGGSSAQGGGGIGGAMQNANSLNNVWGAASQAISGGTAGASMASLGYANIVGAAGGDAIGALAAANGMWAGVATGAQAAAQAAVAANLALEAGTAVALEAGTLAAAGSGGAAAAGTAGISGALAAVPVWGWIALAGMAILSQMDLGSRGANHSGAAASSSGAGNNAAAEKIFGSTSGDWYGDVTQRYSAGMQGQLAGTVGALEGVYNSLTSYAGDTARKIDVLGAFVLNGVHEDEDAYGYGQIRDKLTGEILSSFTNRELGTDKEAAWTTYVGQMGGLIVEQLKASDIPGWMKQQLNTLGDDVTVEGLDAVLKQIATIDMGFKVLGQSMGMFNGMSAQTQTALLNISGGLEGLNTNAGTYYQGFYDEAERMDILSGNLRTALGGLDLSIDPAMGNEAKEQYRKAVEDAFAAGNGDVAAKLLALSGNFASAADYAQKAAEESSQAIIQAAQESAQAAKELADNLRSSLIGLEGRFSGGGLSSQYQSEDAASVLQGLFAGMGVSKSADELSQIILGATPADIEQNFRNMWGMLDSDEARQKLVDVTGAMLDMAGAADSAADASNALFNAIAAYRENLAGVIESAQLQTMTGQGRVDYLTGKESGLWAQLNTTDDPVAVAQKLQQTIIDRINAEADLRFKVDEITLQGLQSQLGVAEALKSAVSSMQSARDSLALGNDSPLNPYAQMQYAGGKFDDAYARALAGDMDAWKDVQSFGQNYVSLGRDNYASSAGSVDIYDRVTAAMDQLIGLGLDVDPQIAALNTQIELQQTTRDNTEQSVWIGQQQVDVLTRLDGVMQAQQSKVQEQGAQTIELLKEQNAKLQQNVEQQKAQMTQQSAMAAQSKEEMQLLRAEIVDLKATVRGQAKAVTA